VRGRQPRAIVMAPTRELANQTAKEFMTVCPGLSVVSVYGGVSISMQVRQWEMVVGGSRASTRQFTKAAGGWQLAHPPLLLQGSATLPHVLPSFAADARPPRRCGRDCGHARPHH